jgi:hypothetical protein
MMNAMVNTDRFSAEDDQAIHETNTSENMKIAPRSGMLTVRLEVLLLHHDKRVRER